MSLRVGRLEVQYIDRHGAWVGTVWVARHTPGGKWLGAVRLATGRENQFEAAPRIRADALVRLMLARELERAARPLPIIDAPKRRRRR